MEVAMNASLNEKASLLLVGDDGATLKTAVNGAKK
jgi:hypothetical protein